MDALAPDEIAHIRTTWQEVFSPIIHKKAKFKPDPNWCRNPKLTVADIRSMRATWAKWQKQLAGEKRPTKPLGQLYGRGYKALAELYNVSMWTARDIVMRKTWKHIT